MLSKYLCLKVNKKSKLTPITSKGVPGLIMNNSLLHIIKKKYKLTFSTTNILSFWIWFMLKKIKTFFVTVTKPPHSETKTSFVIWETNKVFVLNLLSFVLPSLSLLAKMQFDVYNTLYNSSGAGSRHQIWGLSLLISSHCGQTTTSASNYTLLL